MARKVAVIPPRKERTVRSLRANRRVTLLLLAFPLKDHLGNTPHIGSPETKLSAETTAQGNQWA